MNSYHEEDNCLNKGQEHDPEENDTTGQDDGKFEIRCTKCGKNLEN